MQPLCGIHIALDTHLTMEIDWVRAYNRVFEIIDTAGPTYYSGGTFISNRIVDDVAPHTGEKAQAVRALLGGARYFGVPFMSMSTRGTRGTLKRNASEIDGQHRYKQV
jgi:hypothetical protein